MSGPSKTERDPLDYSIVCQVNAQPRRVEFIWSNYGGFFRPYTFEGDRAESLLAQAKKCRSSLNQLISAINNHEPEDRLRELEFELAMNGFDLHNEILPGEETQEVTRSIRRWLDSLTAKPGRKSLEIVIDDPSSSLSVPWNLVYDTDPSDLAPYGATSWRGLGQSEERWRPFWVYRYELSNGRRVEPLKREPVWDQPRTLIVIDDLVTAKLSDEEKQRLSAFLADRKIQPVTTWDDFYRAIKQDYPQLLYWMSHADANRITLGTAMTAEEFRKQFARSAQSQRDNPGGRLAFLNACQTATSGVKNSFLEILRQFGFSGTIATEAQTIDNFANRFGLEFLRGFLEDGKRLGHLLDELRRSHAALGLVYGAHCPPEIRVRRGTDRPGVPPGMAEAFASRQAAEDPPDLPAKPYRSLLSFDESDRLLFSGRDADVVSFAATLDRPDTRIVVLHAESGIGKSSFLRAGVLPYLNSCPGYRLLRGPDGRAVVIQPSRDSAVRLAQGLLDMTAAPLEYVTPAGELLHIDLRAQFDAALGRSTDAMLLREALLEDDSLLTRILGRMAERLPHALVLALDQAEELFTLPDAANGEEIVARDRVLAMLQRIADLDEDVKVIISLRTDYYGPLLDNLRAGRHDLTTVRDYFLRELSEDQTVEAIERPASDRPLAEGQPAPREHYKFRFAEGLPRAIARRALDIRREHQDSVLPVVQVVCSQLYDRDIADPAADRILTAADLGAIGGIEGGLLHFAENTLRDHLRLPGRDADGFRKLFASLCRREPDGTLVPRLVEADKLARDWSGAEPFADVLKRAREASLLRVDSLHLQGPEPRVYVRLGHDALASVAEKWRAQLDHQRLGRANRRKLVIGGLIAAAVCVVLGGFLLWFQDKNRELVRANADADKWLDRAMDSFEKYYTGVSGGALQAGELPEGLRERLLETPRQFYEQLTAELASDPPSSDRERLLLARGLYELGKLSRALGRHKDAKECYEKAAALHGKLIAEQPDNLERQILLAGDYNNLGKVLAEMGIRGEAIGAFRSAIALFERLTRNEHDNSDHQVHQAKLAICLMNVGKALSDQGDRPEAIAAYRKAVEKLGALVKRYPDLPDYQHWQATSFNGLALALGLADGAVRSVNADSFREAANAIRNAVSLHVKLVEHYSNVPEYQKGLAENYDNLGLVRLREGNTTGAIDAFHNSLALFKGLAARQRGVPEYQAQLAQVYINLSAALFENKNQAGAAEAIREAVERYKVLVQQYPRIPDYRYKLASSYMNLGSILQYLKYDMLGAIDAYQNSGAQLELIENFRDVRDYLETLGKIYNNLGLAKMQERDFAGASDAFHNAVKWLEELTQKHPSVLVYQQNLAAALSNLGVVLRLDDPEKAADYLNKSITRYKALVDLDHDNLGYISGLAEAYGNLGLALRRVKSRRREAIDALHEAIMRREALLGREYGDEPDKLYHLAGSYTNLALVLMDAKDWKEALKAYHKAIGLYKDASARWPDAPKYHAGLGQGHHNLALALVTQGRNKEAVDSYRQAIEPLQAAIRLAPGMSAYRKMLSDVYLDLSKALRILNRTDAAAEVARSLRQHRSRDASRLYDVACELALWSAVSEADQGVRIAADSVEVLREAIEAGWNNVTRMAREKALVPLKGREDFQKLIANLYDRNFPASPFAP
jgi:tetratricopeptide (TPR) repeat protein